MPGKQWTTPDQLAFLTSRLPAFLKAQADHTLTAFWASVSFDFFQSWSERALRFPVPEGETSRTLTPDEQLQLTKFIILRKSVCLRRVLSYYVLNAS